MRVLFIYFNNNSRPRTLLSLSVLESVIKQCDHETKIFDTSFYSETIGVQKLESAGIYSPVHNLNITIKTSDMLSDFTRAVKSFSPDLVAYTSYSADIDTHRYLLGGLKKISPSTKVIVGGPAPCINPMESIKEPYVDYVCCGEGENVIKEVCHAIDNNTGLDDIQGLWIKDGDAIKPGGISKMVDINSLPIQNWDSYDPIHIHGLFDGRAYRMGHVEFTRGCPYSCSYCGAGSIRQKYIDSGQPKYVRTKRPSVAIAELKELKEKYNLEMFYFVDGTFTVMPLPVLEEFSVLYKKHIDLPFIALVRPETINKRVAELLGMMQCKHVSIGVESGVRHYRSKVLNRKMSDEQIINAIQMLQNNGVSVSTYNMIGLPGMDREHVFQTIDLNRRANPQTCVVSIFIPFRDNALTQSLINQGLLNEDDIIIGNGLSPSIDIPDMTKEEVIGLFNTFNLYIRMPRWTYPLIRLLEKENCVTKAIRKILYKVFK